MNRPHAEGSHRKSFLMILSHVEKIQKKKMKSYTESQGEEVRTIIIMSRHNSPNVRTFYL